MSQIAVRADGLSKQFRIGELRERYGTFRDTLARAVSAPFRRLRSAHPDGARAEDVERTFWALQDVSFEVEVGEVMGIVGRNGAGKSTLLKVLARITEPTRGTAQIHGRVGSLLEVGTGFHMELTGRENTYLNGAVLGMTRREIDRKFDDIVAFAGVERFIDTPVKRYSSGMYLRLAFAVAAHLEPEILIVDEVLAVGDADFQRKCLGKMEDIAARGRTVLFVSHNLAAVSELCTTSLVLDEGRVAFRGPTSDGLAVYGRTLNRDPGGDFSRGTRWRWVHLGEDSLEASKVIQRDEPIEVRARLDAASRFSSAKVMLLIESFLGNVMIHEVQQLADGSPMEKGAHEVRIEIPPLHLASGVYTVYFKFFGVTESGQSERQVSDRCIFEVGGSRSNHGRAALAPACDWTVKNVEMESAVVG